MTQVVEGSLSDNYSHVEQILINEELNGAMIVTEDYNYFWIMIVH